jgi:hypothetical protein
MVNWSERPSERLIPSDGDPCTLTESGATKSKFRPSKGRLGIGQISRILIKSRFFDTFGLMDDLQLYGYFTDKSDKPAYDPGLDVPCIYCRQKLELPVRSYSLMVPGHNRSYFYRVHRACAEQMEASGEDIHYDSLIIDSIPKEEL